MSDLRARCEEFLKGVTFFDADETIRKFYIEAVVDFAREMRIEGMRAVCRIVVFEKLKHNMNSGEVACENILEQIDKEIQREEEGSI